MTQPAPDAVRDAACHAYIDHEGCGSRVGFNAAADVAYAAGRAAAAAEIRAALADDEADDDVSSGEAIWEQTGYRNGLAAAAEIADPTP